MWFIVWTINEYLIASKTTIIFLKKFKSNWWIFCDVVYSRASLKFCLYFLKVLCLHFIVFPSIYHPISTHFGPQTHETFSTFRTEISCFIWIGSVCRGGWYTFIFHKFLRFEWTKRGQGVGRLVVEYEKGKLGSCFLNINYYVLCWGERW